MNIETIQKNKPGTILRFSIPSIISMLLSTIITITDGYFTGNYVGEDALAAINLGLPILYFYLGVGLCIGVGGSVLCGQLLGSQENRKASEVFSQSVATAFAVCVVTSLAVYLLFPTILGNMYVVLIASIVIAIGLYVGMNLLLGKRRR